MDGRGGERLDRLGDAEVDDLGVRLAVVHRDQHVRRLDVAVDDALLVRVLDGVGDLRHQLEPLRNRELVAIAERRDRLAGHQLHHEVGPAGVGGAGVEDPGDVGVIHHRQRLALLLEAGDHLLGVHPQLDDLERDPARHRLALVGEEHRAEAAGADLFDQGVAAEDRAGSLGGAGRGSERARRYSGGGLVRGIELRRPVRGRLSALDAQRSRFLGADVRSPCALLYSFVRRRRATVDRRTGKRAILLSRTILLASSLIWAVAAGAATPSIDPQDRGRAHRRPDRSEVLRSAGRDAHRR